MRILSWLILRLIYEYIYVYPTASNINIFWNFGILSGLCLVLQIITGLFMSMYYVPTTAEAMSSIEHMMRDINYGWLVRYAHSNGASLFFISVYIHMFRSFFYGTYSHPNEHVWYVGAIIYFCLMGTAFLGYVLPWGQMSFWGATVITNLVTVVPVIGKDVLYVIWGGGSLCDSTLQRFYSLHFLLPFLILGLSMLHIYLLHRAGSRHPVSYDNRFANKISFFPYFVGKDSMVIILFFMFYIYLVFLNPDLLGHPDNYIDANPCVTPSHIVPEWYFLPMYAILRCVPSKVGGIAAMFIFISLIFFIPFFSQGVVCSYRFNANRSIYWLGVAQVMCLTFLGSQLPVDPYDWLSQLCLFIIMAIIINWDVLIINIIGIFIKNNINKKIKSRSSDYVSSSRSSVLHYHSLKSIKNIRFNSSSTCIRFFCTFNSLDSKELEISIYNVVVNKNYKFFIEFNSKFILLDYILILFSIDNSSKFNNSLFYINDILRSIVLLLGSSSDLSLFNFLLQKIYLYVCYNLDNNKYINNFYFFKSTIYSIFVHTRFIIFMSLYKYFDKICFFNISDLTLQINIIYCILDNYNTIKLIDVSSSIELSNIINLLINNNIIIYNSVKYTYFNYYNINISDISYIELLDIYVTLFSLLLDFDFLFWIKFNTYLCNKYETTNKLKLLDSSYTGKLLLGKYIKNSKNFILDNVKDIFKFLNFYYLCSPSLNIINTVNYFDLIEDQNNIIKFFFRYLYTDLHSFTTDISNHMKNFDSSILKLAEDYLIYFGINIKTVNVVYPIVYIIHNIRSWFFYYAGDDSRSYFINQFLYSYYNTFLGIIYNFLSKLIFNEDFYYMLSKNLFKVIYNNYMNSINSIYAKCKFFIKNYNNSLYITTLYKISYISNNMVYDDGYIFMKSNPSSFTSSGSTENLGKSLSNIFKYIEDYFFNFIIYMLKFGYDVLLQLCELFKSIHDEISYIESKSVDFSQLMNFDSYIMLNSVCSIIELLEVNSLFHSKLHSLISNLVNIYIYKFGIDKFYYTLDINFNYILVSLFVMLIRDPDFISYICLEKYLRSIDRAQLLITNLLFINFRKYINMLYNR